MRSGLSPRPPSPRALVVSPSSFRGARRRGGERLAGIERIEERDDPDNGNGNGHGAEGEEPGGTSQQGPSGETLH